MTEENLIERSKKDDFEAFESLISLYQKPILNFTYRMLGNIEDAEDVTQEVFVKAYKGIKSFDGKSSFKTWLYKIASNAAMDELRKRKRRGSDKNVSLFEETEEGEADLPIATDDGVPEKSLQQKEVQRVLSDALNQLNEEHKSVLIMRDVMNLSYEEIAESKGLSLGTVKSRISRGRLILRKILEENRELFYID